MLVWIDLETTGLDPRTEAILEIACIVTTDTLAEVKRYSAVAEHWRARHIVNVFAGMRELGIEKDTAEYNSTLESLSRKTEISKYALEMHWTNGLWKDCAQCWRPTVSAIDMEFVKFLRETSQMPDPNDASKIIKAQLAGSTISFDREFMRALPFSLGELHYRNVDVSTLNELARRFWPSVYAARPNNETKAHRGMADIEESIRVCKHYLNSLAPQAAPL